jgi:hypothetical protein
MFGSAGDFVGQLEVVPVNEVTQRFFQPDDRYEYEVTVKRIPRRPEKKKDDKP